MIGARIDQVRDHTTTIGEPRGMGPSTMASCSNGERHPGLHLSG